MITKKQISEDLDEARRDFISWTRQPLEGLKYTNKIQLCGKINSIFMPIIEKINKQLEAKE